jgi:L-ectoine synthase
MIVRTLQDCTRGDRRVVSEGWESVRLLLRADGMGFSFHITTIYAGATLELWYKNHLESVYCLEGEGEVETCDDGAVYPISAGTIYILDKHDRHVLRARTEMKMACVFNPPLHGKEVHDADGSYLLTGEEVRD